jgi:hypothetical protein
MTSHPEQQNIITFAIANDLLKVITDLINNIFE